MNKYIFNEITVQENELGALISKDGKSTQIYISKPIEYTVEGTIPDWLERTPMQIVDNVKHRICKTNFGLFNGNPKTAALALKGNYDELVKLIGGYSHKRIITLVDNKPVFSFHTEENNKELTQRIRTIEKDFTNLFTQVSNSYDIEIEMYKLNHSYKRVKVKFTIGKDPKEYEYSHGPDSNIKYARDISLNIIDTLHYVDEYKFESFSDYMNFLTDFGYNCGTDGTGRDMIKVGEEVVESMKSTAKAMNMDYEYNIAASLWVSNGFGEGDDKLAQLGYLPESEIDEATCHVLVTFSDEGSAEMQIGFYNKDESPEDDPKDEEVFYHFEIGDDIIGDHGDFTIESIRWEY